MAFSQIQSELAGNPNSFRVLVLSDFRWKFLFSNSPKDDQLAVFQKVIKIGYYCFMDKGQLIIVNDLKNKNNFLHIIKGISASGCLSLIIVCIGRSS